MKNSPLVTSIAEQRILALLHMAESRTKEKTEVADKLARRYVSIAKAIALRYQIRIPKEMKARICSSCGNFLVPGINCKVRIVSSHGYIAYACDCGNESHVFYRKKKLRA